LGQIVKSLIFRGTASGKPILVLTSGANRVDEKRISEYAGNPSDARCGFRKIDDRLRDRRRPPIGHPEQMETYIDEDFLQYPTVWAAAGRQMRFLN